MTDIVQRVSSSRRLGWIRLCAQGQVSLGRVRPTFRSQQHCISCHPTCICCRCYRQVL